MRSQPERLRRRRQEEDAAAAVVLTYGEKLQVCAVILKIQDIQATRSGQTDLLIAYLTAVEGCITWNLQRRTEGGSLEQ